MNRLARAATLLLASSACSGDDGAGEVAFDIWGEEIIEEGIPAAEVEDGWAVTYDAFLVVLSEVSAGGRQIDGSVLLDLTSPGPHGVGAIGSVPAGKVEVGYRIGPATESTVAHASATNDQLSLVKDGRHSVYATGTATKGDESKTFAWGFGTDTRYRACVDVTGGQQLRSLVVPDGGHVDAQLTIHGDHLLYDDLQAPDAELRFQHMADADADGDGAVTLAELGEVPLANVPPEEGPYGVGAADVDDLAAYVAASTRTLGHFNGEGHCEPQ